jgi:large subunit ribosomal protein L30
MAAKPGPGAAGHEIAAETSSGQGGDEHENERTKRVRERARGGDNAGMSRISGERARLRVTQTKSTISHIARNRATVRALGLHGIGSSRVVADNPATRGMVRQVAFLVRVEEIASDTVADEASSARGGDGEKA